MTEKKYRVHDLVKFNYSEIGEYIGENYTDRPLRNDILVDLLNTLYEENQKYLELYLDAKRQLSELAGETCAEKFNLIMCLQKKYNRCDTIGKEVIKDIAKELDINIENIEERQ